MNRGLFHDRKCRPFKAGIYPQRGPHSSVKSTSVLSHVASPTCAERHLSSPVHGATWGKTLKAPHSPLRSWPCQSITTLRQRYSAQHSRQGDRHVWVGDPSSPYTVWVLQDWELSGFKPASRPKGHQGEVTNGVLPEVRLTRQAGEEVMHKLQV